MPGSVAVAVPVTVMPNSLSTRFRHSREYILKANDYKNGESQRGVLVTSSRRRWSIDKRMTPAALATLRNFYDARNGPHEAFYFYDVWETVPKFSHDPTGVATAGRFTVRFVGQWPQEANISRLETSVTVLEIL